MPSLRYLVEVQGADVNARDHNGYSPVHHAAARGDTEMIRYLVEHGADVTLVVDGATKNSSNAPEEGFLMLTYDTDAGVVNGCGWFDAEESAGGEVSTVTDLSFALTLQ